MAARFQELAQAIMNEFLSWDPSLATQVGWHKYDGQLRDLGKAAIDKQAVRCDLLIEELKKVPSASLTLDEQLDCDLAIQLLRLWQFEIRALRMYEHVSSAAADVGNSLFFLFIRDYPSFEERLDAISLRLEAVPRYLEESRVALRAPYRAWNEEAYEAGKEIPLVLRKIAGYFETKPLTPERKERLRAAVKTASDAIERHNEWLKGTVIPRAGPGYALPPLEYTNYFSMKGYGITPDEALRVGETYLDISKKRMKASAKELVPSGDPAEAIRLMKKNRPANFAAAFKEYKDTINRAKEFVVSKNLLSLPDDDELLVMETPEFMRPICPFTQGFEPGKFDEKRTGIFMVTPTGDNEELLGEHCHSAIVSTVTHETYLGRHIQGMCSKKNISFIRVLSNSPDFGEGWGMYSEDMMLLSGFNDTPLGRFVNLYDLVYRIARLVAEIKLVKGFMTLDAAAEMFKRECWMDPGAAMVEAQSCAMFPAYFSAYLLGKLAIYQLRDEVQAALGSRFTLKFFHDSLAYAGSMPMPFMRRAVSIRMKEQFGVELGSQKESLYQYAMRNARDSKL